MNDKVKYWIDIAEYDFDTAKAMLQTKRYLYVGFMCHQVIEKGLKAIIAALGEFPPKTHNLVNLSQNAKVYDKMTEEQQNFVMELNPLNIEGRYPTYTDKLKSILTESKCKEILTKTEELFAWIKKKL